MAECPVGESFIRAMVKRGECPGVYSGSRFLVNVDALFEKLEAESRAEVVTHD